MIITVSTKWLLMVTDGYYLLVVTNGNKWLVMVIYGNYVVFSGN